MLPERHPSRHVRPVKAVAKAGGIGHQHNPVGHPEFQVMTHEPDKPNNPRNGKQQQGCCAAENPPSHLDRKKKKLLYHCDTQIYLGGTGLKQFPQPGPGILGIFDRFMPQAFPRETGPSMTSLS